MKKMLKKRGLRRTGGKRGFTLIELLIVMAIISVLVAIVVMSLTGFIGAGRASVALADQRSLQSAVLAFYAANGQWPTGATQPAADSPADIVWGGYDYDASGTIEDDEKFVPNYVLEQPHSDNQWTTENNNWKVNGGTWLGTVCTEESGSLVYNTEKCLPEP